MSRKKLFTSESVSEGHPDKVADQVSDAVLDACLADDPNSRVACEVFTTTGMVLVGGEITTNTYVDIQKIARDVVKKIGYTNPMYGLDYESMAVINVINAQSPDIAMGVNEGQGLFKEQGAGDQGIMFGYACDETEELMPAPITYAHKILQHSSKLRNEKDVDWLRPDAKSQVTVEYGVNGKISRITDIVVSQQHSPDISYDEIKDYIISKVILPVLIDTNLLTDDTRYLINPTGKFVIGGPQGDTGLTGRKIIVDTYGGVGRHGGGAFSGKDPSKVDRSACYMARYIAKNIVAAGLCKRCEIQLSYAIGYPRPVSITLDTFGTSNVDEAKIEKAINDIFDLSPSGIIKTLNLLDPIYHKTSTYGHFGKAGLSWERTDKVNDFKSLF